MSRDTKGRRKGYKRLFDIGMEIEQSGRLMGSTDSRNPPSWLNAVGGHSYHLDGSGPMEFSLTPAKKNTASLFKTFADGVPLHSRWKWHNEIPYGSGSGGSGCGSHIHFGTKQSVNADVRGDSLSQITIFYNTAITILPFCTKWFSWGNGNRLRSSWQSWCGISGLDRYTQSTIKRKLSMSRGSREGTYGDRYAGRGYMIWNRRTKDKCTLELRVNEGMPQWSLPFVDVFTMIAQKHIEAGDSPKIINHRALMQRLHNDIGRNYRIQDILDDSIEFAEGRELLAPVPHIIGEKFPRVMTVREFLHLIDRVAYWIFAYSSRKLYTKQLRFRALGGDPTMLPIGMAWEPWNYTVKDLFRGSGQDMPSKAWIRDNFPKVVKRTHTPFAHVRMGENRIPEESEDTEVRDDIVVHMNEEESEEPRRLRELIDMFGVEPETELTGLDLSHGDTDSQHIVLQVEVDDDTVHERMLERVNAEAGRLSADDTNHLVGCDNHNVLDHRCDACITIHDVYTANGYACIICVGESISHSATFNSNLQGSVYTCHHGNVNMRFTASTQNNIGCQECTVSFHRVWHRDSVDEQGSGCSQCILRVYNYLMDTILPIMRRG